MPQRAHRARPGARRCSRSVICTRPAWTWTARAAQGGADQGRVGAHRRHRQQAGAGGIHRPSRTDHERRRHVRRRHLPGPARRHAVHDRFFGTELPMAARENYLSPEMAKVREAYRDDGGQVSPARGHPRPRPRPAPTRSWRSSRAWPASSSRPSRLAIHRCATSRCRTTR